MLQSPCSISLIRRIGKKYKLFAGQAGSDHANEIMLTGIPDEAKLFIAVCWFCQYGQIDSTEFFDIASVIEESQSEYIRAKQFIPIGKSGNGDLLVIYWKSVSDTPVGYLRLAEYIDPKKETVECFHQISATLDAFFSEILDGYEIPCDSFACNAPRKRISWWHFWVTR